LPYAAIRKAVLARFWQNPGKAPAYVDTPLGQGREPASLDRYQMSLRLGGKPTSVLVYDIDKAGDNADVWPAVSVRRVGSGPRLSNRHTSTNVDEGVGTAYQHDRVTGREREGPDLVLRREHPEPLDVEFEVQVWSLDQDQADQLLTWVKKVWPLDCHLTYQERDGGDVDVDVVRTTAVDINRSGDDPAVDPGLPGSRFYSWVIGFRVEAYEDNSLETEILPTVRQRDLALGPVEGEPSLVIDSDEFGRS
jgi:hypothetical protein